MLTPDSPIPDILTAAADLLRVNGMDAAIREIPDYWENAHRLPWQPGMALDPTGALAVAMGVTTGRGVIRLLGHVDDTAADPRPAELHPVFRALFQHLGIDPDDELAVSRWFAWCDRQLCHQVIATYRACAAALRGVPA